MENLYIEGYRDDFFVPSVKFDAAAGKLEISGESYLEDTIAFYQPICDWLNEFLDDDTMPVTFDFKLSYFNTSSSRSILDILFILKDFEDRGGKLKVNWHYDKDDLDMKEEVEDYIIESELKINIIAE